MKATATELLGNLYQEVQFQDSAINYQMQVTMGGCAFEVLVNDYPIHREGGYCSSGSISFDVDINEAILG